ncbi:MAG: DUF2007 domain-containing protein [Tissierellia bacterium]|nr:DUF2007 domain-containing protein [Tissierellia bacterium]
MKEVQAVPLLSPDSQLELAIITGALEENKIPHFVKDEGAGGYMKIIGGINIFNTVIFVSEDDYERAKDIVISIIGDRKFK